MAAWRAGLGNERPGGGPHSQSPMWAASPMPIYGAGNGCQRPNWPVHQQQAPDRKRQEHLSWEQQQQMHWQRQQLEIACGDIPYRRDDEVDGHYRHDYAAGGISRSQTGHSLHGTQSADGMQSVQAAEAGRRRGPGGGDEQPALVQMWPWDKSRFEEEELRQKQREEALRQAEERRKRKEECSRVNKAIVEMAESGDFRAAAQQAEAAWKSDVEIGMQTLVMWIEHCARAGMVPLADALKVIGEANKAKRGTGKRGTTGVREIGMDINSYTKMIQSIVCDLATVSSVESLAVVSRQAASALSPLYPPLPTPP